MSFISVVRFSTIRAPNGVINDGPASIVSDVFGNKCSLRTSSFDRAISLLFAQMIKRLSQIYAASRTSSAECAGFSIAAALAKF